MWWQRCDVVANATACSWVSGVVCNGKINMGMVMDLVVSFSIFAVRDGGGFPWWWLMWVCLIIF